jgi:hypothetical protein
LVLRKIRFQTRYWESSAQWRRRWWWMTIKTLRLNARDKRTG